MDMASSDCRGCADRHPGCHDSCIKYAEFRKQVEAEREAERRVKQNELYGRKLSSGTKTSRWRFR